MRIRKTSYIQIKRILDVLLSGLGLILLAPLFLCLAAAIKLDSRGPVFFRQKRVGIHKTYFEILKFRTMRIDTPKDMPTHMLTNPESYITKVGAFLRKTSLDELPQIFNILKGDMSIVGPRPALWNQDDLIAERDKYGANDVTPGLTGWAQVNGRDELEIPVKAKLDGFYVIHRSFRFDCICLLRTVASVLRHDGVVEGGTGEMKRTGRSYTKNKGAEELIGHIGFGEPVEIDHNAHKKVLIVGAGSYIGNAFQDYVSEHYRTNFQIETLDTLDPSWRKQDFSSYDIVYHVAGIAHADVSKVSDQIKETYYAINTDLAIAAAQKAKREGVREFIFMSSMIIYGESAPYGRKKVIDASTVPAPENFYGDSKLQADVGIRALADDKFKVIVLRPPMIYGRGSKGNYPVLAGLAKRLPVFPDVDNARSMLYIGNLCEFLCQLMLVRKIKENAVVLFPQNSEWTKTSEMVMKIAEVSGRKPKRLKILNLAVLLGSKIPGEIGRLTNKAFGSNCYEKEISIYPGLNYQIHSLTESIKKTENPSAWEKKHILVISQYFYPEEFRINDICKEWIRRGYKITVITGIPNYPEGEFFEGYDYEHKRTENWEGIDIIRLAIRPRKTGAINLSLNYLSFVKAGYEWVRKTKIKADRVFIYEVSPMTQALVGVWYAQRHKVSCDLYVTDLWPENVEIVLNIHNKIFLGSIGVMVDYIYKRCDHIFTSSQSFIEKIEKRGVSRDKIMFWPQYAEDFYRKADRTNATEIPDDGEVNLCFAGNFGTAQGLDVLVGAAKLLKGDGIFVRFNMIGSGRFEEELKQHIREAFVEEYFNFIERKPAEKIPEYFAWCDAALITLSKSEVYSMTIPAKTQSCLACGMPVIVSADGEVQEIITSANCGFVSASGDADALAKNIKSFISLTSEEREKMSENAIQYYKKNFDKKILMDKMEEYIR